MDNSFLHSKRLLLVDDEQELLKMVSDILKDAGFETVLTAMSVKEAVQQRTRQQTNYRDWDLVQTTTFLSPLCRRNCYCVSMRCCGEPTKRIRRCLF